MEPYYTAPGCTLYLGDSRAVLPTLDAQSVDAVVTDPPYELAFMGRTWDRSGIANDVAFWRAVLRVMKPGAHLLAFGGTRTAHRMVCAIEDAGFEIRDTICWLYGQGFPKSLDVGKALDKAAGAERAVVGARIYADGTRAHTSVPYEASSDGQWRTPTGIYNVGDQNTKATRTAPATDLARQWDGWGTALKPAYEPIVLARAPLAEPTVAANVARWGTGALNVDGGRISQDGGGSHGRAATAGNGIYGALPQQPDVQNTAGRWPPNCALSHTLWCSPIGERKVQSNGHYPANRGRGGLGTAGHAGQDGLAEQHTAGETVEAWACHESCPVRLLDAQSGACPTGGGGITKRNHNSVAYSGPASSQDRATIGYADTGGASRFFYVAKASAAERSRGLPEGERNQHPTVKPVELCRWLARLICPPGGVLDPFAGSGSIGVAAALEGFSFIGIEQSEEYCTTARARLGYSTGVGSGLD